MKKLWKRSVSLPIVVLSIILTFSIAFATVMFFVDVNLTMNITGEWNITVLDTDTVTPLNNIAIGDIQCGESVWFPETPSDPASVVYILKNLGDYETYLSWNIQGTWPTNVVLTMYIKRGDQPDNAYVTLNQNEIFSLPLLQTGGSTQYAQWYFQISAGNPSEIGSYTPSIRWNANDGV